MRKSLSRREFFQRLTHDLSDQVNTMAVKKASSIVFVASLKDQEPQSEWIAIAKQSEMSPGVEKKVIIENLSLTLHSSGEGIWVDLEDGKRIALRVEAMGVISAKPDIEWPAYRVLSHITGEVVDLVQDDSKRETSHES